LADPGPLVGRGRAADVFDVGGGRVLRRYRTSHDSAPEAAIMAHVASHGFPVPAVHDVDGRDLVMDRVVGPSQLDDIERRPWRVAAHGRVLADLHRRLDLVPAPAGGGGGGVVHLDLHPGNVLCTPDGPVVIDWSNGRAGDRHEDVATTWMLLAVGRPDGGAAIQILARLLRQRLLRAFLSDVDVEAARAALAEVCDRKLSDPNMGPAELEAIRALAASEGT
jgi:aminoglycoside phosphotransferase (APT) family kinase protein